MEQLTNLLDINKYVRSDNKNQYLSNLATLLFGSYAIINGRHVYRPVEIEFYIFAEGTNDDEHVYPRNAHAGQLYFHKSGFDICFESNIEKGCFGGILIRTIEKEDGTLIGGPQNCAFEILNSATQLPIFVKTTEINNNSNPASKRIGIKKFQADPGEKWEDNFADLPLRFVRCNTPQKIRRQVQSYDFRHSTAIINNITYNLEP